MLGLLRRLVRGERRIVHRPDWPRFAGPRFADHIMHVPVTDRFHAKQGRSTGRWILRNSTGRLAVYLKRHYDLPWWRRLLATLWPDAPWSPAFAERRHLEWARARGIPVPDVVAAGEFIGPWFRLQSFLAVAELAGMTPLHEAIALAKERLPAEAHAAWKRILIHELARLTRMLHDAKRFHKDYYLCHFFIRAEDIAWPLKSFKDRVFLIDLHRLQRHQLTEDHWRIKDLAQLLYSSAVSGVNDRDRLRFLRLYQGASESKGRRLLQAVVSKAARYRRHNERQGPVGQAFQPDYRRQLSGWKA
jgi:Lipopolysaccharide kinase (Kdo/WaaP) family